MCRLRWWRPLHVFRHNSQCVLLESSTLIDSVLHPLNLVGLPLPCGVSLLSFRVSCFVFRVVGWVVVLSFVVVVVVVVEARPKERH